MLFPMKVPREKIEEWVIDSLEKAEGNRDEAARIMGVSRRTLDRHIQVYRLYEELDRRGWIRQKGPPRLDGTSEPSHAEELLAYMQRVGREVSVEELTRHFYNEDTRNARNNIASLLSYHGRRGLIQRVRRGVWQVVPLQRTSSKL